MFLLLRITKFPNIYSEKESLSVPNICSEKESQKLKWRQAIHDKIFDAKPAIKMLDRIQENVYDGFSI